MVYLSLFASLFGLGFAAFTAFYLLRQKEEKDKVYEISQAIREGANAFLKREYQILLLFVALVSVAIFWVSGIETTIAFVFGSLFSAVAGNLGMRIATTSNAKTARAAKTSINKALKLAFQSGLVIGLSVVSMGLLGIVALYFIFNNVEVIFGFGFGASSIALFARVGGGIYTKAADVGADLVGKLEAGIPEDDPRNPAVIADNVGDNVGDVAGMGADLFESYVDSIIAAMILGTFALAYSKTVLELPLAVAAVGIAASIVGSFFVGAKNQKDIASGLNRGIVVASVLSAAGSFLVILKLTGSLEVFWATVSGLLAGIAIGFSTEYFTSKERKPVLGIVQASKTGAATNIISGLSLGMMSTLIPVLVTAGALLIAYYFSGLFGIAMAAVGMLSTLGITLATDAYGPVVDNAAGIAQMAGLGKTARKRAESLDSIGNTTAAVGKGFAIGSAALTALALFASYIKITGIETINLAEPVSVVGLFVGGMLPFVFSALTIGAVSKAASKMADEVRRQFKEIKGLMEGKSKPNFARCVDISTQAALKQMVLPTSIAILTPLAVGYFFGAQALGGLLAGVMVSGFMLALFMANSGGAWDNAKKYVEEGHFGGKGSSVHKATVVGDTVGDSLKDTAGPSLNILIKLISIVALVFAPLFLTR